MSIKKAICICLIFVFAFSLFGCTSEPTNQNTPNPSSKDASVNDSEKTKESKKEALDKHLPETDLGEYDINYYISLGHMDADIDDVSEEGFRQYIDLCKKSGYTIEIAEDENEFIAYNEEGYKIDVDYYSWGEYLDVTLYLPKELTTIKWPKSKVAAVAPQPKSNYGKIEHDSSDGFEILVGNTSLEEFQDFIDECMDAGFTDEYEREETWFVGFNENGDKLMMEYEGFKIFRMVLMSAEYLKKDEVDDEPETEEKSTEEESTTEKQNNNSLSGIRPEIKEAIDSYESFIDEYCEFMKSYDSSDLTMLTSYLQLLSKEEDMAEQFEELEDNDLSDEELAYYVEVSGRCSAKLLSVH